MQIEKLERHKAALESKAGELIRTLRDRKLIAVEYTPEACEQRVLAAQSKPRHLHAKAPQNLKQMLQVHDRQRFLQMSMQSVDKFVGKLRRDAPSA